MPAGLAAVWGSESSSPNDLHSYIPRCSVPVMTNTTAAPAHTNPRASMSAPAAVRAVAIELQRVLRERGVAFGIGDNPFGCIDFTSQVACDNGIELVRLCEVGGDVRVTMFSEAGMEAFADFTRVPAPLVATFAAAYL